MNEILNSGSSVQQGADKKEAIEKVTNINLTESFKMASVIAQERGIDVALEKKVDQNFRAVLKQAGCIVQEKERIEAVRPTQKRQIEIEKIKTILHDDYGHKVPLDVSTSTTSEDKLPRFGEDTYEFRVLDYLHDVKQAFVSDIACKLGKKNNYVNAILSKLKKKGFVRTGLDWRIKITPAGIEYIYIYKDNNLQQLTTTYDNSTESPKEIIKEKKNHHQQHNRQLNFDAWIGTRPYLSQEGVMLALIFIKNYEDNGTKEVSGHTFGDFENNLRALWNYYNNGKTFPGEADLQMRIHELKSFGFIKTWNRGCYKLYINEDAFQVMQEVNL